MKNLWPEEFKAKDIKPAKQILEEQSALLPKLTGDMVLAEVSSMGISSRFLLDHYNDFKFSFLMKGKFLKNYSFKVFDFSHEITIYPIKMSLDELIAHELGVDEFLEIMNEGAFVTILGKILSSERINDVIGSIIRISSLELA